MKICLVGHYTGNSDEGVKNVANMLYKELSRQYEVLKINISVIDILKSIAKLKKFRPDIIHLVVGPDTILSFFLSKFMAILFRDAIVVMSAPHPTKFHLEWLIRFLKPDLILVQSKNSEERFRRLSCNVKLLRGAVDNKKFVPIAEKTKKRALRWKYGIIENKFVILHVGHIKKERNLLILENLQKEDTHVIVIGSTSTKIESCVYNRLKNKGVTILTKYFPQIEEMYQLSDCYVFPTKNKLNAIETPLSVLEAMSCNLPVITTKFGALPEMFKEGEGIFFVETDDDIINVVNFIKNNKKNMVRVKTRKKVMKYSIENMINRLKRIYKELLSQHETLSCVNDYLY